MHEARRKVADHDGESRRAGEKQRQHVNAQRPGAGRASPSPRDVVPHGTRAAGFRCVESHDQREGHHAEGRQQHSERSDRAGQRSDDAEEESDVDERTNAEALTNQRHEPKPGVAQLARVGGIFNGRRRHEVKALAYFRERGKDRSAFPGDHARLARRGGCPRPAHPWETISPARAPVTTAGASGS